MMERLIDSCAKTVMVMTHDEVDVATDYIRECLVGGHTNPTRLALCQWIVEMIGDGEISIKE